MDKLTALDEVILAIVAAVKADVSYPVWDGPVSKRPDRSETKILLIGAEEYTDPSEDASDTNAAKMDQEWVGLGQAAREETLEIYCVAIGRGTTVANARSLAMAVVKDVGDNIGLHPTNETYGAFISSVSAARSRNTSGGAIVQIQFVISAKARLT